MVSSKTQKTLGFPGHITLCVDLGTGSAYTNLSACADACIKLDFAKQPAASVLHTAEDVSLLQNFIFDSGSAETSNGKHNPWVDINKVATSATILTERSEPINFVSMSSF